MKKIIMSSLLVLANYAFSATIWLAVVDAEINPKTPAAELDAGDIYQITEEIRRQTKNSLTENYKLITDMSIMAQGDEVMQKCAEENCKAALAEIIGADYITESIISKYRGILSLSITIYSKNKGTPIVYFDPIKIEISNRIENNDVHKLIQEIGKITPSMFKKFMENTPEVIAIREEMERKKREKEKQEEELEKKEKTETKYGIYGGVGGSDPFDNGDFYYGPFSAAGGLTVKFFPFADASLAVSVEPAVTYHYYGCDDYHGVCIIGYNSVWSVVIPAILRKYYLWNHFYIGAGPQITINTSYVKDAIYYDDFSFGIGARAVLGFEFWRLGLALNGDFCFTEPKSAGLLFLLYIYL